MGESGGRWRRVEESGVFPVSLLAATVTDIVHVHEPLGASVDVHVHVHVGTGLLGHSRMWEQPPGVRWAQATSTV